MQGDWGLNKGDFASKTDALGSVARRSGETNYTKDLADGRIHGARRDCESSRNSTLIVVTYSRLRPDVVLRTAWLCAGEGAVSGQ